jgi:phosphatidylinositol phospholipase C delta
MSLKNEEVKKLFDAYSKDNRMHIANFSKFLLSKTCLILNEDKYKLYQTMDKPLTQYYMASSHNTYLLGNQLNGMSSTEGYKRALISGCRCVECKIAVFL